MSDGIAQAAVLSKAVVVEGIPETVLHQIGHPEISEEAPHITLQASKPQARWAAKEQVDEMSRQELASIEPLSPLIDLASDHIYNDNAVVARPESSSSLHTLMWSREQDQKYPWTKEQNAANAVLLTFGAAVAEATRKQTPRDLKKDPVVVKGVQLVDGKLDMVTFQLNTLNLSSEDTTKNIVWIEKACSLYTPKPFYEQLTEIAHSNSSFLCHISARPSRGAESVTDRGAKEIHY
ncbi:hypothetical protein ANCCAN_10001 [Ancylostoma caninum]|uniref:Uncharacterized protein n=1 Tax=Ancylostoma caninum TaxID=29170 RepID=A0A368GHX3_ANCCA|nr:hypothetical protein ANCCAN_10001 [Ancylostoma caninum]